MHINRTVSLLLVFLASGVLVAACEQADSHTAREFDSQSSVPLHEKWRGVHFDARSQTPDGTVRRIQSMGANVLVLNTFGFQRTAEDTEIRMNPDARRFSESDDGIRIIAQEAQVLGVSVVLKPHIWVGSFREGHEWSSDISFASEAEWRAWEASYRRFALHYARLSEEINAPMFVIGSELRNSVRERPQFWRRLISEIRKDYTGLLTFGANWDGEYEEITFWDALDFIGVQAYFPLAGNPAASTDELVSGWGRHTERLEELVLYFRRPVIFTEIGYRSARSAAAEPWSWLTRNEAEVDEPADGLQAQLYEAFFRGPWQEEWLAGALFWKWHPEAEAARPRRRLDFTPQGKPAENVLERWFQEGREAAAGDRSS